MPSSTVVETLRRDRAGGDLVDAHVVAVAVEAGGGVVVTGDRADLERLSASYRHLAVERI